ncbi:proline-rich protein 5 isoform X2 [Pipistrellus kuhlii]|nr:proline-rich protein 5 isoform X2 [Pipistrellus kuhlii]XP_045431042.1 proline-rich protein 5 isoform X2 [Pipistrellus kuhlii]
MSSPSLSDLGKREPAAAAADERGTQQRRACANATWNSIHNGVIAVFQRKGLPDQELFSLNEGVRQLLKTELGSFFTEYLQNQLLTKGMVILRDKIRFYEEAAGLAGRDVGLLLQRRAAHAAGHLLPRAGQGAVGAPAGPAALPRRHHAQREAGGRAGPCPRPGAPRHRADAAGAPGRARGPRRDQGLPAPGDAGAEGGVALPGHLRPLLRRGLLHTLLRPREAPAAPFPLGRRPGQDPGGALQELQHAAAEPRGRARGRGRGGRGRAPALRLRAALLPGRARPRPRPRGGPRALPGHPVRALPQQTAPPASAPRARARPRLPGLQPRAPGGPRPGVRGLGQRGHLHRLRPARRGGRRGVRGGPRPAELRVRAARFLLSPCAVCACVCVCVREREVFTLSQPVPGQPGHSSISLFGGKPSLLPLSPAQCPCPGCPHPGSPASCGHRCTGQPCVLGGHHHSLRPARHAHTHGDCDSGRVTRPRNGPRTHLPPPPRGTPRVRTLGAACPHWPWAGQDGGGIKRVSPARAGVGSLAQGH